MKYAYIDFEFNSTQERKINLVCCSILIDGVTHSFWIFQDNLALNTLRNFILSHLDRTFVSYSVESEARSFIALNLHPLKFKWLDLYLEYRLATNHSKFSFGKHLTKEGKVKFRKNFLETMEQEGVDFYRAVDIHKEEESTSELSHSLASACYRLLGITIDTVEKTTMRNIIISNDTYDIIRNRIKISEYCDHDVKYLPDILVKLDELGVLPGYQLRAEYAVRTAMMVTHGYPIDVAALKRFTENVPTLLSTCREDINKILSSQGIIEPFFKDKKGEWHFAKKKVQEYILANFDTKRWELTSGGQISLSEDALQAQGASKHTYKHTLIDQLARFAALESSVRGFKDPTKSSQKRIWDYLGSDGRVRPYFGIYGSQSGRSQQSATSFIFLKSAWIRVLVQPKPGYCIIGCDYSSQEFLLSALLSNDKSMEKAYNSGDVYLDFACTTKLITEPMPEFNTIQYKNFKKKYDNERNTCKSLVLGLSYMMGANGLANKLTTESKTGKIFYREDAEELIRLFKNTYSVFTEWQEKLISKYEAYRDPITLPCGWKMYGQNPNPKSIGNFSIQGMGATLMRKAVSLCQDNSLKVIMTLHDCIYIESKIEDREEHGRLLQKYMQDAFKFYFPDATIRMDLKSWGENTPIPYHIDPRGINEWAKYYTYVMPEWIKTVPRDSWIAAYKKKDPEDAGGWLRRFYRYSIFDEGVARETFSDGCSHKSESDGTAIITFSELIPYLNF